MGAAVAEVDAKTEENPEAEAMPSGERQIRHEVAAREDGERRDEPDGGAFEIALEVRLGLSEYHDADGGDEEGGERADVCHLCNHADGEDARDDGDENRAEDRHAVRRMKATMDLADVRRHHAVAAHREEDARLAVEEHEQHRRDAADRADGYNGGADVVADVAQREGDRLRRVEHRIRHDAREDGGDNGVEQRTDEERADDADGQIPCGVAALFRRRRDGVEADVGEEDDGRARDDAAVAERQERIPIRRVDVRCSEHEEEEDRSELDEDEDAVELDALLRAAHEEERQKERDEDGGQVEDAAFFGRGDKLMRQHESRRGEESDDVARPADGDGARRHRVFEDEIPANDKGDELAQGRIGVGVGAARGGHDGSELRVGKTRKRTRESREDERQRHGRPCVLGGSDAREHEDARADDGADAEHQEVDSGEVLEHARGRSRSLQLVDAFPAKKVHDRFLPLQRI